MALSSSALLPLAQIMGLAPSDAIALPTVMSVCARKAGITEDYLFHKALGNAELRAYMAGVCRQALSEVGA